MSRARHQETLHAVQLFPFVAVLLCTMGSLLVLLVGVARSSKVRAVEEAAIQQAAAKVAAAARAVESEESIAANRLELEKIAKYQAEIAAVRAKAEDRLQQDKLRMGHLEDHMRRLREKLESLKLAAAEMNGLEGEQIDNRKQAESEIQRLEQLIAESATNIDRLRADAKLRARSYAIVPYQAKTGTYRRPIYIECRDGEVVLQPEGVVFTIDDFQPPIGPGNPLIAAVRAAREHIMRTESSAATGKAAEPYPLIIVRPSGVKFYYYTREAVQSWDSEFGYELVEEEWELKYGPADPQLANVEYDAAELSRGRLRALAAAAPQAYGAYRGGGEGGRGGRYPSGYAAVGYDDEEMEDGEYAASGGTSGGRSSARLAARPGGGRAIVVGRPSGAAVGGAGGSGTGRGGMSSRTGEEGRRSGNAYGMTDDRYTGNSSSLSGTKSGGPSGAGGSAASGTVSKNGTRNGANGPSSQGGPSGQDGPQGAAANGVVAGGPSMGGGTAGAGGAQPMDAQAAIEGETEPDKAPPGGRYAGAYDPNAKLDEMARAAAAGDDPDAQRRKRGKVRGKNWAIRNANPGMIPIRRTIQIVVRDDAVAILPESSSKVAGQEFKFDNLPEAAYEDLASAVDKRIDDWGMAGQGLYWRPVVDLKVAPGGDGRVDNLLRLLQHSGVEVRSAAVAQHEEGSGHANR